MSSATEHAVRLLAPRNLHQCLWLPERPSHARLRITFATTSNFDNKSLPCILFVGPMFGSRYNALLFNKLAKDVGVRVICVDRPGIGGSTPVPLRERLPVWLETVPALLQALDVKHVSLVSHSAGTLYLLNTLDAYREILHSKAPYVALLAPWVHMQYSGSGLWTAASKLPQGAFSYWSGLSGFINQNVQSLGALSSAFTPKKSSTCEAETSSQSGNYGVSKKVEAEVDRLMADYLFNWESMKGGNEEALLLLKKDASVSWGACEDYVAYVKTLNERETERQKQDEGYAKLKVRLFFAKSDIMIGKQGQNYFEDVWKSGCAPDAIELESTEMSGTNHDSVLVDLEKGALRRIVEEIKGLA
ncbi:unnamed protein product [Zymoseptoria tritici ST99CH_1A5]|uniref:AB hydrolase-1 domain-containing protein n=1 Tax=Zymoseptoria tritici ST99CH_1A5 TaxID=1276529 RepID=A0A1Y6LGP3_ZYMTR|nr:unnamed protein product [Zymoseptoria tritici ST99CH_1A5]